MTKKQNIQFIAIENTPVEVEPTYNCRCYEKGEITTLTCRLEIKEKELTEEERKKLIEMFDLMHFFYFKENGGIE